MIEVGFSNRTAPALTRGLLDGTFNRVAPALTRETLDNIHLGKRVGPSGADSRMEPLRQIAQARREASPLGRSEASSGDAKPVLQGAATAADQRPPLQGRSADGPSGMRSEASPLGRREASPLEHRAQRGQKVSLGIGQGSQVQLRVGFGWNVRDARCDIDASAFLLAADRRVPSDDWFVFYGQPTSPDGAVRFVEDGREDREVITVDLGRLRADIQRIVFVMTINEALERGLNFGMIQEAWLRVMDQSGRQIVSFSPTELFDSVASMTLGEIYLHNGEWRFNPVGNGMNTDLAGQCAVYGVQISG